MSEEHRQLFLDKLSISLKLFKNQFYQKYQ